MLDLKKVYLRYIDCLNARDWSGLGAFVGDHVVYNDEPVGLASYRDALVRNCEEIPDLVFAITLLVADAPWIAARIVFDCTPRRDFMGIAVDGRKISFAENVFYQFDADGKIARVWSVIDKAAIEAQTRP